MEEEQRERERQQAQRLTARGVASVENTQAA